MPTIALLVIDLQRGAFDGVRCPPIDEPERLLGGAQRLLAAARAGGRPVVFVQHCDVEGDVFEDGSPHGELHESLAPRAGEAVVRKRASSAFEGTELARLLADDEAGEVIVCGLQSEFCIANTARAALAQGLAVSVAHDGHGTWPSGGDSAEAIRARVNAVLEQAGARLASVESLAGSLCAARH